MSFSVRYPLKPWNLWISCKQQLSPCVLHASNLQHLADFPLQLSAQTLLPQSGRQLRYANIKLIMPRAYIYKEVRNKREDQLSTRKTAYKNDAGFCLLSLQL